MIILRPTKWVCGRSKGKTEKSMRPLLVLLWGALLFSSCGEDQPPEGILTTSEMVTVMQEVYIAEEKVSRLGLRTDSTKKVFQMMEAKIFEKAGTTDSVFRRSMRYYMEQPDDWEEIYSAVIDSLNLREQRLALPEEP
jgi:hypothetical protein